MADIELVIKITEDTYKNIIENGFIYDEDNEEVTHAIKNGTSLSKGHGRLIDADAVNKKMKECKGNLQDDWLMWENSAVSKALDMYAPTIIEADKAESEQ